MTKSGMFKKAHEIIYDSPAYEEALAALLTFWEKGEK